MLLENQRLQEQPVPDEKDRRLLEASGRLKAERAVRANAAKKRANTQTVTAAAAAVEETTTATYKIDSDGDGRREGAVTPTRQPRAKPQPPVPVSPSSTTSSDEDDTTAVASARAGASAGAGASAEAGAENREEGKKKRSPKRRVERSTDKSFKETDNRSEESIELEKLAKEFGVQVDALNTLFEDSNISKVSNTDANRFSEIYGALRTKQLEELQKLTKAASTIEASTETVNLVSEGEFEASVAKLQYYIRLVQQAVKNFNTVSEGLSKYGKTAKLLAKKEEYNRLRAATTSAESKKGHVKEKPKSGSSWFGFTDALSNAASSVKSTFYGSETTDPKAEKEATKKKRSTRRKPAKKVEEVTNRHSAISSSPTTHTPDRDSRCSEAAESTRSNRGSRRSRRDRRDRSLSPSKS